ncbi:amidohydrolase family protein [Microbacterium sp. LTA6]|uniref:amidohydrolase family protein n=1 Tax=unclassified Microbacterium TaxID=2609290 RepID=UPI003138F429
MRVLDSHLHLWRPDLLEYTWLEGPLAFEFAALELEHARIEGATEVGAVFVQAECVEAQFLDEVRWVTGLAREAGVKAIVAGARLDEGASTTAHLEALAEFGLVVGVRHLLQGERDGLAATPAFIAGARALAAREWTFDACVRAAQLPDITALAAAVPELRVVLDHVGKPAVGMASAPLAPSAQWVSDLTALAQHPNVYCKLSGLPGEAGGDWDAAQVAPFLDAAAAAFGPERLMWGSDWPVSVIGPAEPGDPHAPADGAPTYQPTARTRWAQTVVAWATSRGHDVDAILWANAARFYGIDSAPRRGGILGWLRGDRG